jgi:hypothetical protein
MLSGGMAIITLIWTLQQLSVYSLRLFDLFALVGSCLVLLAASLEQRWENIDIDVPDDHVIHVHYITSHGATA